MSRLLILLYGVLCYFIGVAGLVAIIVALPGIVPWGFLLNQTDSVSNPILWNSMLVLIWGLVHTGMAREGFKSVITKIIPEPAERPTYVLVAGITSIALVGLWKIVPGQVWLVENNIAVFILWGVFILGWALTFVATFAINHFDLFGLRQVYLHYKQMPRPPVEFVKRAMYRYIRHPIQTGVLIGVWVTPSMTMTQIILSIGFTIYIFIGLWFEERDLVKIHGEDYIQYRNEAGKLFPKIGK